MGVKTYLRKESEFDAVREGGQRGTRRAMRWGGILTMGSRSWLMSTKVDGFESVSQAEVVR